MREWHKSEMINKTTLRLLLEIYTPGTPRLNFRRSLGSGFLPRGVSVGSFPEQRLVIKPTRDLTEQQKKISEL